MPSDAERIVTRLGHNLDNIGAVKEFTAGLSYEEWLSRREMVYAVVRALEIISEASRHLPEDLKGRYPDVPWREIKAAGNVYRHGYEEVSLDIIWNTAQHDLVPLQQAAEVELKRFSRTA
jgi:uncharacterized protein with HEPN domain